MEDGEAGNCQREDVVLDQSARQEGPRIDERELGNKCQIGDDDLRVTRPLSVADGGAQDRLHAENY